MLVRTLPEYFVQFWLPCYREDIIEQERDQKRLTRMLPGLEGLSYKEELDRLGLFSVEHWRMSGDLIAVYKIMRGMDKVNGKCHFPWVGDFKTGRLIFL
eukprot:g26043.t1